MPSFQTSKPEMGGAFKALPAGDYDFEIVDAKETTARQSGNAMIELKLKIKDIYVWDFLVFTEKAFWKIDQLLKATGCHPGEGKTIDVEADEFIGHKGRCKLKVGKTDKGNERNEVESYIWEEEGF